MTATFWIVSGFGLGALGALATGIWLLYRFLMDLLGGRETVW
jgi:hypothetical protein